MLGSQENCPPNIFLGIFGENPFFIFSLHFDSFVRLEHQASNNLHQYFIWQALHTDVLGWLIWIDQPKAVPNVNGNQIFGFIQYSLGCQLYTSSKNICLAQSGLIPLESCTVILATTTQYQCRPLGANQRPQNKILKPIWGGFLSSFQP